jgi:Xaa-Pro aminopeptidase
MAQEKLGVLRGLMAARGLDAYIVTSGDAHGSEYAADYWHSRRWLSGFTGSAGLVVVLANKAGLWTDGRYFLQAERELAGSEIILFKQLEPDVPTYQAFLAENVPRNGRIGFDGRMMSVTSFGALKKALPNAEFLHSEDLIGEIWRDERPPLPAEKAFVHEEKFAGKGAAEKLADVRAKMQAQKIDAYLVTALDAVAWLFNIRGGDIEGLPVPYAFAVITAREAFIFLDSAKLRLQIAGVEQRGYDELPKFLRGLNAKVFFNPHTTNVLLSQAMQNKGEFKPAEEIIPLLKAVKTAAEIENIKNAFIKDGVVFTKMLYWLAQQTATVTEGDIAKKLQALRREQPYYLCDSFSTIAAYGANAAQAHYSAGEGGAALQASGFLLVDSGGQYLDGTTDTTRTIALGALSHEMKRDFTLVLKGHIALARAIFPGGTTGTNLDILARLPLWQNGQNFKHGTGHGLGYCLSVHEGPHSISQHPNAVALARGMLLTNEPAYYKENSHGIRTENVLLVREHKQTPAGVFLSFETLTHCPIDTGAILPEMLTADERDWLNTYHTRTYEALSPHLSPDECAWLKRATQGI